MGKTTIEWTDYTFNPWIGCTKVSLGCKNCYAETLSNRWGNDVWGKGKERKRTSVANWKNPILWNKEAKKSGKNKNVFCASMADVFDQEVPNLWRFDLFGLIEATPNLNWLILTKRPEHIKTSGLIYMDNVWLGTSVEDQETADYRIPHLVGNDAKVHFLSCEPLIENIDLEYPKSLWPKGPPMCCSGYECGCRGMPVDPPLIWHIEWLICGGESGPHCRPMDIKWARSLRDYSQKSNVKYFLKQLGGFPDKRHQLDDFPLDLRIREMPI
jgi:protein gp37